MREPGLNEHSRNPEYELRTELINDVFNRVGDIMATNPYAIHLDSREPANGLLVSNVPSGDMASYQKSFEGITKSIRNRWLRTRRQAPDTMPVLDYATLDILRSPKGEMYGLTTVHSVSGGVTRELMLSMNDDGLEKSYGIFADENGTRQTLQEVELPRDEFYSTMQRLLASDPEQITAFLYLYYGVTDLAERDAALEYVKCCIQQSTDQADAEMMIKELRRRYELAKEAEKLRRRLGETDEMSNMDLMNLSDLLGRRAAE